VNYETPNQTEDHGMVYISGPIHGSGIVEDNVRRAVTCAEELLLCGYTPIVPHLNVLWNLISPHEASFWLLMDYNLLSRCDAVVRLIGESPGSDLEKEWTLKLGIPYYVADTPEYQEFLWNH